MMERKYALELLRSGSTGITEWNSRRARGDEIPELRHADLSGARLRGVNLSRAILVDARLDGADLMQADLAEAILSRAKARNAELSDASLYRAILSGAMLEGCRLCRANLCESILSEADLTNADLSGADIRRAVIHETTLTQCALDGALLMETVLSSDLRGIRGLDRVVHHGPSIVYLESLRLMGEALPRNFVRGCGVDEPVIDLFAGSPARERRYASCFISYCTADEEFASRLHNDFQAAGIRCWKWNVDAQTGRPLWKEIDHAIKTHDRLVIILSAHSLASPAVVRELERGIQEEDRRRAGTVESGAATDSDVVFPVRLDRHVFDRWQHERKADVVSKVIADATGWDRDPAVYAQVRARLVEDLRRPAASKTG